VIAFVGSVFSPYYAWSGRADPLDHCAINVALYGPTGQRWAMTERRRDAVVREGATLTIGPSSVSWHGEGLTIRLDEVTAPAPSRIRGTIEIRPEALVGQTFALDGAGRHRWRPIAPRADVEVTLTSPAGGWRGKGYFDTNAGEAPLQDAFSAWDWSRVHRDRDTLLFYDVQTRDDGFANLAMRVSPTGEMEAVRAPPQSPLATTFWRIRRNVRGDAARPPRLRRTLEDTPFYARSALDGHYDGEAAEVIHESLDLDRLRSPIIQAMLPFRMPRRFW
jgi:carotenoid 1,2-hydratase